MNLKAKASFAPKTSLELFLVVYVSFFILKYQASSIMTLLLIISKPMNSFAFREIQNKIIQCTIQ